MCACVFQFQVRTLKEGKDIALVHGEYTRVMQEKGYFETVMLYSRGDETMARLELVFILYFGTFFPSKLPF